MSNTLYLILGSVMVLGILLGIVMMSKVKTARLGNQIGTFCLFAVILLTMIHTRMYANIGAWLFLAAGSVIGVIAASRVQMIQMPQVVALLNGLGGAASALVAIVSLAGSAGFYMYTAQLALCVGAVTFSGSIVAAGKLAKLFPQKPVVLPSHSLITGVLLIATVISMVLSGQAWLGTLLLSLLFGVVFAIRVGGADMPITISLLNSLSGVAGGIAGIALADPVLIAVGGIVGASGLLLTQIMCRAMNRSLVAILLGKTAAVAPKKAAPAAQPAEAPVAEAPIEEASVKEAPAVQVDPAVAMVQNAKDVIIVPGYGMALSQAQQSVRQLADAFEQRGARVRYAIHPVAGRMPGHMNVLLCEADVDYEQLFEMDDINSDFAACDLAIAIGANDTINPAANTAEGTPIYGMPVLDIGDAKNVIILNLDDRPGYAGVPNPLYTREDVVFMKGDAKESIRSLMDMMNGEAPASAEAAAVEPVAAEDDPAVAMVQNAKDVIIVPGYGMALSQAQQSVRQLADAFEQRGARVRYAIHPVAGRMPGHMNVLLCEADVDYEQLFEMDDINADFATCDLAIAIGANDTINPAANTAEGTPIYGMPVLDIGDAKNVIILNLDDRPGYAGVPNPLYTREDVVFMKGDAKESIQQLKDMMK